MEQSDLAKVDLPSEDYQMNMRFQWNLNKRTCRHPSPSLSIFVSVQMLHLNQQFSSDLIVNWPGKILHTLFVNLGSIAYLLRLR